MYIRIYGYSYDTLHYIMASLIMHEYIYIMYEYIILIREVCSSKMENKSIVHLKNYN